MQTPWQRSTAAKDYWLLRLPRLLERKLRWRRLGWGAIFALVTNHDRGDTKESYLIVDDAPSRLELATQILQKYGVAVDLNYSMRLEYRRFHPGEVEPDEFRDARIELTEYQAHLQSATRHLIECGLVIPIIDTEEWTLWPSATILRERHRCRALLSGDLVPTGRSQQIVSVKNTRTPFSARASVHPAASSDRKQSALDLGRGMDLEQALSILELETDAECVGTFPVLVQATPLNTVSSTSASVPLHWVVQQPQDEEEETQEHTKTFVSLQGAVIRKLSVSSGNARFRQPKEIEPSEDGRRRLETATAAHFGTPVTWESLVQRQAVWASHELESHLGRHQSSGFLASSVGTLDSKMGPHPVPASPRLSQRIALLRCLEVAKAQFGAFSLSPGVYCIPLFRRKGIQESTKVEALKPAHGNHSWDIIPAHVSVVVYGPRLALSSLETEYYEHVTLHPECYTGNGWSHPERRPPTANLVISSAYVDEDDTISFNHTIRPVNHRLQYAAAEQYSVTDPQQALRQQILDVFEDRGGALVREADIAAHVQKATGWRDILTTVAELVDARRRLWRMYDSSGQAQLT